MVTPEGGGAFWSGFGLQFDEVRVVQGAFARGMSEDKFRQDVAALQVAKGDVHGDFDAVTCAHG